MAFCHHVVPLDAWLDVSMCVALFTTHWKSLEVTGSHWKSLEVTGTIEMDDIGTNT